LSNPNTLFPSLASSSKPPIGIHDFKGDATTTNARRHVQIST
jgi:hypothetical protein